MASQSGVCILWPWSVAAETVVNCATSAAGNAGPVYFQFGSVTPRPAMPDMFIELAPPLAFDDLPEEVIDIPFMEEDEPVMFIPDMDGDDEAGAAAELLLGITATADGIRITANTAPSAPSGFAARNRDAGVGSSARSGTKGRTESPMRAMIGPLFGSVPPKVSSFPKPSPVTQ